MRWNYPKIWNYKWPLNCLFAPICWLICSLHALTIDLLRFDYKRNVHYTHCIVYIINGMIKICVHTQHLFDAIQPSAWLLAHTHTQVILNTNKSKSTNSCEKIENSGHTKPKPIVWLPRHAMPSRFDAHDMQCLRMYAPFTPLNIWYSGPVSVLERPLNAHCSNRKIDFLFLHKPSLFFVN